MHRKFIPQIVERGSRRDIVYDLEIVVLIHYSGRYARRLEGFKKLGFTNLSSFQVHVTLLGSPGDSSAKEAILTGWPVGLDVSLLECYSQEPLPKVTSYYLFIDECTVRARWYLRVDDDSWTDISGLIGYADEKFGDIPIHLMTPPVHHDRHMHELLRELNLRIPAVHEHESSITSRSAMRALLENEKARHFLQIAMDRYTHPGDLPLAWAMQICGVPGFVLDVSTKHFERSQMSICGGRMLHIHYVLWEDKFFTEMLEDFVDGTIEEWRVSDEKEFAGKEVFFGRCVGQLLNRFTLDADGTISGDHDRNEAHWRILANVLILGSFDHSTCTVFNRVLRNKGREWILGDFSAERTTHFIQKVEDIHFS